MLDVEDRFVVVEWEWGSRLFKRHTSLMEGDIALDRLRPRDDSFVFGCGRALMRLRSAAAAC